MTGKPEPSPWGNYLNKWTDEDAEFELRTKQTARERMRKPGGPKRPPNWWEPYTLFEDTEESPKITDIEVNIVELPYERELSRREWLNNVAIVRISTDTGLTGWGHHLFPDSTFTKLVIEKKLKKGVIGRNPFRIEQITKSLMGSESRFHRKHFIMYAIGAIDQALWDIMGKYCNLPVYKLLGGYRDKLATYLSIFQRTPEGVNDIWEYAKDNGYDNALKLHTTSPELVKETRDIIGDDVKLMVDCTGWEYFTRQGAIELGKELEKYNIFWYEDPLPMVDLDGFAKVTEALDTPVVTGARDTSRWTFKDYAERGIADVWNPDVIVCGGITQWMKIASFAEVYGIPVTPHLNHLASMHMTAASPNASLLEIGTYELQGYGPSVGDLLVEYPLDAEDGWITLPEKPGLGYEFDEDKIEENKIKE